MKKVLSVPENVRKLAEYINTQSNPEQFMQALFRVSRSEPRPDNLTDTHKECQIGV